MASGLPFAALLLVSSFCFASSEDGARRYFPIGFCPEGWTQFNYRCFKFYAGPKSWVDGEDFCNSIGGYLASISSRDETEFLRGLSRNSRSWVGGKESVKDGLWMWTDGRTFDYTQWARGEPNGPRFNKCLEINFKGADWDAVGCERRSGFICATNVAFPW